MIHSTSCLGALGLSMHPRTSVILNWSLICSSKQNCRAGYHPPGCVFPARLCEISPGCALGLWYWIREPIFHRNQCSVGHAAHSQAWNRGMHPPGQLNDAHGRAYVSESMLYQTLTPSNLSDYASVYWTIKANFWPQRRSATVNKSNSRF